MWLQWAPDDEVGAKVMAGNNAREGLAAQRRTPDAPGTKTAALKAAFPLTLPILASFVFLGITCGIYATSLGLPAWMPTLLSIAIFAGSSEFVAASLLTGAFNPLQAFVMVFVVNARHLFYGLSMLGRLRGVGRKKGYLIYGMCDETFSLVYGTMPPKGVDRRWFMFFITLLNQSYWIVGCTLGGVFGSMLALNVKGISFAMTALFTVIFVDQWLKDASHVGAVCGIAGSVLALVAFGADAFMIPAMLIILASVTLLRGRIEPAYEAAGAMGDAALQRAGGEQAPADDKDKEGGCR